MSKKLWGGRFEKSTDPLVEKFTRSIHYDHLLGACDVIGSMMHVNILKTSRIITGREAQLLQKALAATLKQIAHIDKKKSEDIHTAIQNRLQKKVGDIALKLHTARSRNDQVVFATKLYSKITIEKIRARIEKLRKAIESLGSRNKALIMPGFTHLQHAQPVYLKDYLSAYGQMLERDAQRLRSINESIGMTLGAGALAGTPIHAKEYKGDISKLLKGVKGKTFRLKAVTNSLDAVSDRDFVIEIISALSIIAMHLSRLSEDLIIWSTKEFDFIEIDDSFCTGSSLMPQKKNPDVLELVRGYAGRVYGNLVSVLTMMKGLPLAYNRDMQLDKEPLFESAGIVMDELEVLTGLVKTVTFNVSRIKEHLKDEALYATDIVYYLVGKKVPFKTAHTIVGRLIKHSLDRGIAIKEMPESVLKRFSAMFVKKDLIKLFDPSVSVASKRSIRRRRS